MKRPSLKPTLSILTFLIGVIAVSLWNFSNVELISEKSLSEAISTVRPVEHIYENPCDYPQPHSRELKAEEAVYQAECFIIQNGYTDLPPIADKSKITPESVWGFTDDEGMKMRRDTLERKAYSYEHSEMYEGWVIMFRPKQHPELVARFGEEPFEKWGRAVVVDFNGKQVRIQHLPYPLNSQDAKVINR
jgi:hypothetical protein